MLQKASHVKYMDSSQKNLKYASNVIYRKRSFDNKYVADELASLNVINSYFLNTA